MGQMVMSNLVILYAVVCLLAGLVVVILFDPYIQKQKRRILLINVALIASYIAAGLAQDSVTVYGDIPPLRTLLAIYSYVLAPVITLLFCYLLRDQSRHLPVWILLGVNLLIHCTSLFSGICFQIVNNHFIRGPLGYASHITSSLVLLYLIALILQIGLRKKTKRVLLLPLFSAVFVVMAVLLDTFIVQTEKVVTFLACSMVISSLFYYIWLHLQFVEDHERALMAEQRIRIMMSQIQPHFLYNTLSSIQALCRIDPEQAFDVTEKFGTYLRENLDALDQPDLIPFSKELAHTRVYAEIEAIRFPNIRVTYDTPDLDFSLPALSVQPLVENAIRHGVRIKKEGRVEVSSRFAGGFHEIRIRDNGKGFDPDSIGKKEGDGTHIGIRNVRERLLKMCGGTLTVESHMGKGTIVILRIPASAFEHDTKQKDRGLAT